MSAQLKQRELVDESESERETGLPSHKQLLLPVLQAVEAMGGSAVPRDVVDAVAEELKIPDHIRHYRGVVSGREVNLFARRVRWVRQDGIRRGFLTAETYGRWKLTEPGFEHLRNIRPGFVVTIYETEHGTALWAEAEAAAAVIRDECVNLIITSPPYPLVKAKRYGNRTGQDYLDWLLGLAVEWRRMLVDDGSLVLNLMDCWQKGMPIQSLYQERLLLRLVDELGFHFAQRFYYHNPGKITSSDWVTIKRVRVKNVMEHVFWLSKTPHPKADNRLVLEPYSDRMRKLITKGGEFRKLRPSGHGDTKGAFGRDNGGSIPSNLFTATNAASTDHYHRQCRLHGLESHPARWPASIPRLFIKMLTSEGDTVCDPFFGSGVTGEICEELKRKWIGSERSLVYLSGSKFNMPSYRNTAPGLCSI